jgi:hypothetical protein
MLAVAQFAVRAVSTSMPVSAPVSTMMLLNTSPA